MFRVEPMDPSHVEASAAHLLARLRREAEAGSPWRDQALDDARWLAEGIEARLAFGDALVALHDGEVAGFVQPWERTDAPWLPSAWVEFLAHAAPDPAAYRALYASGAGAWVERGLLDHYAVVPPLDETVWAFFALGFGLEQVYAIRSLDDVEARNATDVEVRGATGDDFDRLKDLFEVLPRYQQGSPTFGMNTIARAELEEGHRELLNDPNVHYWIALRGDRAVGFMIFEPVDTDSQPHMPRRTIGLDVAAVADDERGSGIGGALTSAGLRRAADEGFTHCLTDWRSPNPTSGPIWTRWGFRPYAYRLHRTIDVRLAPR